MTFQEFLLNISSALAISDSELLHLVAKAPYSYKSYKIKKKTGGDRVISQPAKEIKYIQHVLIEFFLNKLPIHESATAYKKGGSIKSNAAAHRENTYISKFDFKDFFSSIKAADISLHLEKHLGDDLPPESYQLISRTCCIRHKGAEELCLSIGAPSSPLLSNTIMYELDQKISEWCQENQVIYTRYADDLTFSSNIKGKSFEIENVLRSILSATPSPKLSINNKKTIHVSKKGTRRVTGLIITNDDKISLGREKKRLISSMIHRNLTQGLKSKDIEKLQGLLGLAKDIEPIFCSRMRKKYGAATISEILQYRREEPEED
ncbi:putative RNA-directed DNA polymerase [Pseudomonas aeruginosa]|uniref:retron St85 family RNA-directed DNA polymerase n=1 Tax=Pseudomonas aeruginosa TaxID=287 RepID=UPI0009A65687|nr:retron St85 family RNA-directed DNA polymerase [Pseudomonas aeruginosa]SQC51902.1 putative RNA-directed DNA polymerase [Pseudomonas aeruginosa]HBN9706511.1 retron St85 family RNA-directed DNA polymerase [Pseudomonas aeruginosa]HBN9725441.1 retron St85 family RNA-directed DNA polymerase [Pseudomonas aeruginosa]HBN9771444.1 retron St85 family RNA-directed DNA polymerase [Pseudomonas aeruginosa]HBN9893187.1 retron St85 family RNA-directed DNA polymerase [Pseudomonas aeruginosa]